MSLRQRLENLTVSQKLLAALLVLLATVLLVANLAFISAAYWISRENTAPQALHSLGRLIATPALSREALTSPGKAAALLDTLESFSTVRAAALYGSDGQRLAQLPRGEKLQLPEGFYQGIVTASLVILGFSLLLWMVVARQIKRLVTRPIRRLEELSRQVTREENYALRARRGNNDELGSLAEAFNTMLSRMEAREQELKRARDEAQVAIEQARQLTKETRHSNRKLEMEVQVRNKIEKKLTGFQNYLNSIIDSMPSALIAIDEQLYVTQWNQEASLLSGTRLTG